MTSCETHRLWRAVLLQSFLTVGWGYADTLCTTRRCLAQMLIDRGLLTQPQGDTCINQVHVPFIEYQTLAVDTKNQRVVSRMQAQLEWKDPEMTWNYSVYNFDNVVLPVDKVWTPEIHVTNGIETSMKHSSRDVLVNSDGQMKHKVSLHTAVSCEVNLFNYPFAGDECPVALQTWPDEGCGTELILDDVYMIDGTHGDWRTDYVSLMNQSSTRIYIMVKLSTKYLNPFITLLLPTILIILADIVSFALPLRGGERNSFKVTLVLSFTMFLIILNDQLPGDGECSPIIRTHYCICLVFLMLSMLLSMVFTRMAKDGRIISCGARRGNENESDDKELKADISVVQMNASDESRILRKVLNFLEDFHAKEVEGAKHEAFADKLDNIFFWVYAVGGTSYFVAMLCVLINYRCSVNHFAFWYDL